MSDVKREVRVPKSRKKKPFPVKIVVISAAVLAMAAGGFGVGYYMYEAKQYREVFFPMTTINGVDASRKTVEEVKDMIASGIDGYKLTVKGRNGLEETITKEEIGLHSVFDGSLEAYLADQDPMDWWSHRKETTNFQISTMIAYDEGQFQKRMEELACLDSGNMTAPKDAYLSGYISGTGYQIIPEEAGTVLDVQAVRQGISDAIMNLETELSLEELGVYEEPAVTSDNEALRNQMDTLNRYVGVTVTHTFGDQSEVLGGDTIASWLTVGQDGSVSLDREQVAAYVKSLASKYDTAYKKKQLKTSYGETVTISQGFYGWRIDQAKETEELCAIIASGESQTREPVYKQKAASHGANDYGDTYVEINLTAQHLFFYKDGKLIVETDFVSGNLAKGHDTPAGAYPLTYKQRDAVLRGKKLANGKYEYESPVDYWMPFNGGIGLHDASWRSSFGGAIYKTSGSHGCVNLPPAAAKKIFENISAGDPVLCYHLEGTEKGTTSSTKPVETQPVETTPVETTPSETEPTEPTQEETRPTESTQEETQPTEPTQEETQPSEPTQEETKPTEPSKEEPGSENQSGGPSGPGGSVEEPSKKPAGPGEPTKPVGPGA